MINFEPAAREIYSPIAEKYGLQFAALDNGRFFLIGHGFALYVFVDPRDGADTWYVSVDEKGNVFAYTLMYLLEKRFTTQDSATNYGNLDTFDGRVEAVMRADVAWLLNKCQDILTGDKTWLRGYQGNEHHIQHVTQFLAPYFRKQGYPVIIKDEN